MKPWQWQFPPVSKPLPLLEQIRSITWEVMEAVEAHEEGESPERVAEEIMDAIHRAESALSELKRTEDVDLDQVKQDVIEKNARRGYYGEVSR